MTDPTITVPLHDLCDLLMVVVEAIGEDGLDELPVDDAAAFTRIADACTKALVSAHPIPPPGSSPSTAWTEARPCEPI